MRIYVAGPYSADNIIGVLDNIRKGIKYCAGLLAYGYTPFCPWTDFQLALTEQGGMIKKEDYQRNSMEWLKVSDIMIMLPGWESSRGTIRERIEAERIGIPVYIANGRMLEDIKKPQLYTIKEVEKMFLKEKK